MPSSSSSPASGRIGWVDATRGLGIFLMFYGHVLQKGIAPGNASAADQVRLIYSFHMPLFFILAGGFFKAPGTGWWRRIPRLMVRRLVPFFFFGLLLLPLWVRDEEHLHVSMGHDALHLAWSYLRGDPELNWVTWFLACLFTCEVLALPWLGRLRSPLGAVAVGLAIAGGGVWLCNQGFAFTQPWFLGEAVVGLGLYTIGHAVFPYLGRLARLDGNRALAAGVFIVGVAIVLVTYRLNQAAGDAVMMAGARQGNPGYFLVTALAGGAALLALGVALSGLRWLEAAGRHSLPLLGLNGLFFHYGNHLLQRWWPFPDSHVGIAIDATIVSLASLLACAPIVYLLDRYLPQLIGKPAASGPWLSALEPRARPVAAATNT